MKHSSDLVFPAFGGSHADLRVTTTFFEPCAVTYGQSAKSLLPEMKLTFGAQLPAPVQLLQTES